MPQVRQATARSPDMSRRRVRAMSTMKPSAKLRLLRSARFRNPAVALGGQPRCARRGHDIGEVSVRHLRRATTTHRPPTHHPSTRTPRSATSIPRHGDALDHRRLAGRHEPFTDPPDTPTVTALPTSFHRVPFRAETHPSGLGPAAREPLQFLSIADLRCHDADDPRRRQGSRSLVAMEFRWSNQP